MMKYILLSLCFLIIGCNNKKLDTKENISESKLVNFTYEDVAKYTMSALMNQPVEVITINKEGDLYIVSYVRKSDNQKFIYKVKFISDTVLWANIDGRWRDSQYDEKILFEESGDVLKVHIIYSDGSKDIKEFRK